MYPFTKNILSKGLSYASFNEYTQQIIDKKITPELYRDLAYYNYTVSNFKRGKKLVEQVQLNKKLYNEISKGIQDWTWVVMDEPWCGDASFSVPILHLMELASAGDIEMKIFRRDEHPEIMEHYLTNNGKAIPKLVCLNKDLEELGTWGPRPAILQEMVKEWVAAGIDTDEKIKRVHQWYLKDKSETIQKEFIDLIKNWKTADER